MICSDSDPYIEFSILFQEHWHPLYRTEAQFNTLNPSYRPFVISRVDDDISCILEWPLLIRCINFISASKKKEDDEEGDEVVGQFITNLKDVTLL